MKDTHVKVYYRFYSPTELWEALIIIVLGLLPIVNIVLFVAFIIYYAIHAGWNPDNCDDYTYVFSLRRDNIVTKGLLKVKNILCKKV